MNVFISWSGGLSKSVAELLKVWLKCVLQATEPWVSTEDIDKGSMWFGEISQQLKDTSVGIVCLTRENLDARWILFEAGGMAKGLTQNRVCTFLVNVGDTDVKPPLSMFNSTKPVKEDVFKLVQSINGYLGEKGLTENILNKTFEQFWPEFEKEFKSALESHKSTAKPTERPTEEIVEEILQISRDIQRHLQQPSPPPSLFRFGGKNSVIGRRRRFTDDEIKEATRAMAGKSLTAEMVEQLDILDSFRDGESPPP